MKKLENRVAVVTGGSRGIGKGIALAFAKEGANIVFSFRCNEQAAQSTVKEIEACGVRALAIQADAGREEDVKRLAQTIEKEFGKINILVNNAGTIGLEVPVTEMETSEWDRVINTDLRGVFLNCKYLIPLMAKGQGEPVGKIINISSELSKKGRAGYGHYAAAKGAINSFTMCLALEMAPDILVNIIAPGPIETDMILADMEPEWVEKEKDIPLQRLGKVEEISAAALLLASDDGNFFCGQFVSPNGGAVFF
ncbi:SDR family oxidoreductase [Anaerovorax odorimutans]|uniref:SDR family oxidoreductase n=1 Tax=Anaerovorax odorimutans TaxID=109327 RepID=A0ABT1RM91_9FIRM|nr:SDR family oxidoreductase [Anaerovorax odorimutans]MCQ4636298.1 SDR family oxidoreductase [Anaerovorax odorimutans]